MINVAMPPTRWAARSYAVDFILRTVLGLQYTVSTHAESSTVVTRAGQDGRIVIADVLLATEDDSWLAPGSLPRSPLPRWDTSADLPVARLVSSSVPVIYGHGPPWLITDEAELTLHVDVFGSAFFMLSRYEELIDVSRDEHDRFPANASLASREGFLGRPLVDEFAELLWGCLRYLWPSLQRPSSTGGLRVSHDVDWPWSQSVGLGTTLRRGVGDVLVRRSPRAAVTRLRAWLERRGGRFEHDPNNSFERLMDVSDRYGLKSAFYFIAGRSAGEIDGDYDLSHPFIQALLSRIHERGHEIGLHPSYGTYKDPTRLRDEFDRLLEATSALGISQAQWGGRQHYLRWRAPTTWRAWSDAGLAYDSTVGYADHVGFRSGTCHDHRVFDLHRVEALQLVERPLIVMENTLLDDRYMALDLDNAVRTAVDLAKICARFGGHFNLLWHNSSFVTPRHHRAYEAIIHAASESYASARGSAP